MTPGMESTERDRDAGTFPENDFCISSHGRRDRINEMLVSSSYDFSNDPRARGLFIRRFGKSAECAE